MSVTIVILAPAGRGRKKIDCWIFWAPGSAVALFIELDLLKNLRSDYWEEGLVACHHGLFAVHNMTSHGREEDVFRKHFDDAAIAIFWKVPVCTWKVPSAFFDTTHFVDFV